MGLRVGRRVFTLPSVSLQSRVSCVAEWAIRITVWALGGNPVRLL